MRCTICDKESDRFVIEERQGRIKLDTACYSCLSTIKYENSDFNIDNVLSEDKYD